MNGQQAQQIEKEAQNMPLEIGFKRLSDNAILPTRAHATDSGFDLYAAEDVIVSPGQTVIVPTNIAIQIPPGHEAQVRPRSGITSRTKLRVQLGTIDESYRGGVGIIVDNINPKTDRRTIGYHSLVISDAIVCADHMVAYGTYLIEKGTKLAQLVVQPIPATVAVEITGELEDSDRGANGWGSSGV